MTRLCRDAYGQRNDGRGASFGIIQAQRQMASCMVAMTEYIEQRLAAIDDDASESGDAEGGNDESSQAIQPDWGALGDLEVWRRRLGAHDSKLEALCDIVRMLDREEPGAKILVFTFFPRTAYYLCRRLGDRGIAAEALTGATPTNPLNPGARRAPSADRALQVGSVYPGACGHQCR